MHTVVALKALSKELRELGIGRNIDVLEYPFEALDFSRYVCSNKPCLLRGAIDHWPALQKWTNEYLSHKATLNDKVTVAITPDGRADAVKRLDAGAEYFALPLEERVSMAEVMARLEAEEQGDANEVCYLQQQNNCMAEVFQPLLEDMDEHLPWATKAMGGRPEAVNLWVGGSRSLTTFHKDPYENLYVVVRGTKTFKLMPPSDVFRMHIGTYQTAQYARSRHCSLELRPCEPASEVRWCPIDTTLDDLEARRRHPMFWDAVLPGPLTVTVTAGEVLYLPALWFHQVQQSCGPVVAVNYWHDMMFEQPYALFGLVQRLCSPADESEIHPIEGSVL